MDKIALIPAYNPDDKLITLTEKLKKEKIKVVLVNDGSKEECDEIFKKSYGHLISYKENKGKGYALKKGLKYIQDNYNDAYIVTLDSDGQHKIEDALKLMDCLKEHNDSLVLGSRPRNDEMPLRSTLGNSITRFIFRLKTKVDVYDTQTGLRAFSSSLIPFMLKIDGDRFEYEMNVLLYATKEHIEIKEIPIETIYIDKYEKSHFRVVKDSYQIYKQIFSFKRK